MMSSGSWGSSMQNGGTEKSLAQRPCSGRKGTGFACRRANLQEPACQIPCREISCAAIFLNKEMCSSIRSSQNAVRTGCSDPMRRRKTRYAASSMPGYLPRSQRQRSGTRRIISAGSLCLRNGSRSMKAVIPLVREQVAAMAQEIERKMEDDPVLRAKAVPFIQRLAAIRKMAMVPGIGTLPGMSW